MGNELVTTPMQQLTMSAWTAVGTIAGILLGLKYKHPVVGFFVGTSVGSVIGISQVVYTRQMVDPRPSNGADAMRQSASGATTIRTPDGRTVTVPSEAPRNPVVSQNSIGNRAAAPSMTN